MTLQTQAEDITSSFINSSKLPIIFEPLNKRMELKDFLKLLQEKNSFFKSHLLEHGGILFRNFPIHNEADFAKVIQHLDTGKCMDYIGGDSPRKRIIDGIYTSTEAPPSIKIPLHNELSFVKKYPTHIYFYCDIAPIKNGETTIASAKKVHDSISSEVKKKFVDKGLYYTSSYFYKNDYLEKINQLQGGCFKSWIHVFETESKKEVEQKCKENEFDFEWLPNDWIRIGQKRPAIHIHPVTQDPVWFNQAHIFDLSPKFLGWWRYLGVQLLYCRKHMKLHQIHFGNKEKIPRQDLSHVLDVLDSHTVTFPWQKGDVLVLDNILTMHGRSTFSGKRRVLVAMTGGS